MTGTHDASAVSHDAAQMPGYNPVHAAQAARVWEQEELLHSTGTVVCSTWSNQEGLRVNFSSSEELLARQALRRVLGAAAEDVIISMNAVSEDWTEERPTST